MKTKIAISFQLSLLLSANVAICFFFLEPSSKAKTLLFCFLFFACILIKTIKYFNCSVLALCLINIFLLLLFSSYLSHYYIYSILAFAIILAVPFYWILSTELLLDDNYSKSLFFVRFVCVFALVASLLGLYEFFSFSFLGKSGKMLISYLLPQNKSIRVGGIYGQPNLFALLLLSGILSFFYTYLHDPIFSLFKCRIKYLYYLPIFVVALCFFLTGSRAGLLAMLCTLLFMGLMVARKRYLASQPELRRKFCLMLLVVWLAWLGSFVLGNVFIVDDSRSMTSVGMSADARFMFWAAAWLIFLDHPWFGIGLDNYKFYLSEYLPKAHEWLGFVPYESMGYTKWAHNELLQLVCEGGVLVLLILLSLLGVFTYQLFRFATSKCNWSPLKFYSHIFIIPFIIQSMFSWALRHPGLLVLFFTFLAMLAAQYPGKVVSIPRWGQYSLKGVAFIALIAVVFIAMQETKMGLFAKSMTPENARDGFSRFEELIVEPYTEYPMLLHLTPRYVQVALKNSDKEFGAKILPYVQKLTDIQGAHWQWYNLAAICNLVENRECAHNAIESAIHVRPSEEKYWAFQHYLNMQDASDKTGRPLEDFLPIPPGGDAMDLKDMFDLDGRNLIEM